MQWIIQACNVFKHCRPHKSRIYKKIIVNVMLLLHKKQRASLYRGEDITYI